MGVRNGAEYAYDQTKQKRLLQNLFHIHLVISDWDTNKTIYDPKNNEITDINMNGMADFMTSGLYQKLVFFRKDEFFLMKEKLGGYLLSQENFMNCFASSQRKAFQDQRQQNHSISNFE